MSEPVMVTGLGLSTSLGFGVGKNWDALLNGTSGIREMPAEAFATPVPLPLPVGAPVDRVELAGRIQEAAPRNIWNTSAEVTHLWLLTALEALAQAGLWPDATAIDSARAGIFVGNGGGAVHFIEAEFAAIYTAEKPVFRDVSRMAVPKYMASSLAGQLSILTGFGGASMTLNTACSSGGTALVMALDALRLGRIDLAVAGGADMPVAATVLRGFHKLRALTAQPARGPAASRPFDGLRDGFVLGEGAACLVLERADAAAARGATPLAVLNGGAAASEAYHLLRPREEGAGMIHCMALALDDAGVSPARVRHVYAHGTGTRDNDRCEAGAIASLLPHRPSVSASKGLLGHTIGAAGAIDAVLAVKTLGTGRAVPCVNLDAPDPGCDLNFARDAELPEPHLTSDAAVMVNTFAFGGQNAALLLGPAPSTSRV